MHFTSRNVTFVTCSRCTPFGILNLRQKK
uniref:Uncharacterized protein n=1 Tax=Arundo donax TaxID=35708 RepID=A0A0A9AX73_ARUDO